MLSIYSRAKYIEDRVMMLCSQAPSNSKQALFYTSLYEIYKQNIECYFDSLQHGHFIENTNNSERMPEGTILAGSDKGLGLCLLPIDWYIKQYEVQSIKGGHILTKMSKDQCINQLKETIQNF